MRLAGYAVASSLLAIIGGSILLTACGGGASMGSPNGLGINLSNNATVSFNARAQSTAAATPRANLDAITPSGNANATFKGCLYKSQKNRYQAVRISVGTAGTYPFNAVLYSGTACKTIADQFGFGQPLTLGKSDYIFWFSDFKNLTNMSAIWYLGTQNSKCVSYAAAPSC